MNRLSQKIGIDGIDLEKILNFLPYPFLVSEQGDNARHNIFVNKIFTEEIGYSCAEIPTLDDWFLKAYPDPDYRREIVDDWTKREQNAKDSNRDFVTSKAKIQTSKHGARWYEVKASMFGTIRFVAFVNIDEDVKREAELERLNENKNLTLSVLSHDLRSPLHNLYSVLDLTLHGNLTETEQRQLLEKLSNQVFQMMEFLDTTLQWTRINFEEQKSTNEILNIEKIAEDVLDIYNPALSKKQLNVKVQIDKDHKLTGDAGVWSILIRNIISNAIKFTPQSGDISIYNPPMNGRYILAIENSGQGIAKEKIDMILNKKYKSENGTAGERGLGLGLKLCQHLLEKMGGQLDIESVDGKSTVVKIVASGMK